MKFHSRSLSLYLSFPLLFAGCVLRNDGKTAPVPSRPADAPLDLELSRWPSGERHSIASDRGHVVLLDVWATWCPPCRAALPQYQAFAREYGQRGFRVYAVNTDKDDSEVGPFVRELGLELPILRDPDMATVKERLGTKAMPTTYLLDRRGRVRHVHVGFVDVFVEKYRLEIEALLQEELP